ncbi:MAG: hypothetical protein ACPGGK_17620, partial [Pikeienuella sp.]
GHLEIELALPPIPAATDELEIDLFPTKSGNGYQGGLTCTYARICCTWISAFPIFFSALRWRTNDWNGKVDLYWEVEETCQAIGAAFAAELATFETKGHYAISANNFERLMSYYIETGLMDTEGEEPFTNAGKRLARRHRIANVGRDAFNVVQGEVAYKQFESPSNLEDEIPF